VHPHFPKSKTKSFSANSNRATPPSSITRQLRIVDKERPAAASNGTFRIGKDTFALKLLYDEMVTPGSSAIADWRADLHRTRQLSTPLRTNRSQSKTPQQVLMMLGENHPARISCSGVSVTHSRLIEFIREKQIVTFLPTCGPRWKRRRRSCARRPRPLWIRLAPSSSLHYRILNVNICRRSLERRTNGQSHACLQRCTS